MSYPELFGQYELLEFKFEKEEDFNKSTDLLNKIFTPNPNFWSSRKNIWVHIGKKKLMIPLLINSGDIKIYKYTFKEPREPQEEDKFICYSLSDIGRIKSEITFQLYWRAYNFFKEKGFYLKPNYSSTYLSLTLNPKKAVGKEYYNYDIERKYFSDNINNKEEDFKNIELEKYNTVIRCGEMEGYRFLEFANKKNYLWIFPFIYDDDYNENEIPCYLFEFTDEYEKVKMREMKEALSVLRERRSGNFKEKS